jgi:hypothetical protein
MFEETKSIFKELLKTIRDTIDLTRALGERFLWVDAVRIIQPDGDDEDWRDQSPLMWQYYRDLVCTIAAARSIEQLRRISLRKARSVIPSADMRT